MRLSRDATGPVLITIAMQIAVALTIASIQISAPAISDHEGLDVRLIGPFVAGCYAVAMILSLRAGGIVLRWGAVRSGQICLIAAAGAAALFASGWPPAMLLSAVGYGVALGLAVPASSQMIARHTGGRELPLAMSLGQSGMTIGRLTAGVAVPSLVLLIGWSHTLIVWAALAIVLAVALEGSRRRLDPHSTRFHKIGRRGIGEPLRMIRTNPLLFRLAFASIVFASAQLSLVVYLVTYMHEEAGLSLVSAGLAFALAQAAGIANRFLVGGVASVIGRPRLVLSLLGFGMAATLAGVTTLSPGWPTALVLLGAILLGGVAMSWNGLLFSEVIRAAGIGHAATATGAISFVTFVGLTLGPAIFGLLLALGGSYANGFLVFAGLVAVASAVILPTARVAAESP
ncbi:MAG: MFS transporter [Alphaproteobacteria bacterium]|nr:MFS transporter [Alphaproteobacteria bacterium]